MQDDDVTEERKDGKTPNGGAYSIAYYQDADNNSAPKSKAVNIMIVEFDKGGKSIQRTYLVKK